MDTSLENATVKQLATLIEKGSLSPVELTEYYLNRIERLDQRLNSFMLITHERARAAAKAAEIAIAGGNYLGPLHGIPFAVKDLVNVAGLPTTNGSILFKERIARNDATVFRKLLQAGIVLIGKTGQVAHAEKAIEHYTREIADRVVEPLALENQGGTRRPDSYNNDPRILVSMAMKLAAKLAHEIGRKGSRKTARIWRRASLTSTLTRFVSIPAWSRYRREFCLAQC